MFKSKILKINLERYSIYELLYFNEVLKEIFKIRKEIVEKRVKQDKFFLYYEINNLYELCEITKIKDDKIKECVLLISFNCKNFKEVLIQIETESIKNCKMINIAVKNIHNYLLDINDKILRNTEYVDNYFFEMFQLSYGCFSNYYDLKNISLDFGLRQEHYYNPIIVKTKIKYKKIINNELNFFKKNVDTIMLDRSIILNLIQLFLRVPFEPITNGIYYNNPNFECIHKLDESINGKFTECNRIGLVNFQDEFIPNDVMKMFEYFDKLSYEEQCVFLQASEAYLEGLRSNNGKEIVFFVIALETLSNYENKSENSKAKMIYNFIKELFDINVVDETYIEYIYDLRSLYSHQGISNNQIKRNIFDVKEMNCKLIYDVEKITYSILTKWLIKKGEDCG